MKRTSWIYDLMHSTSSRSTTSGHRGTQVKVLQQVSNMEIRQSPPEKRHERPQGRCDMVDRLGQSSSLVTKQTDHLPPCRFQAAALVEAAHHSNDEPAQLHAASDCGPGILRGQEPQSNWLPVHPMHPGRSIKQEPAIPPTAGCRKNHDWGIPQLERIPPQRDAEPWWS